MIEKEIAMVTTGHSNVAVVTAQGKVSVSDLSFEDWGEILTRAKEVLTVGSLSSLVSLPKLLESAGHAESLYDSTNGRIGGDMVWEVSGHDRQDFLLLSEMGRKELPGPECSGTYLVFRRGKDGASTIFALTVRWRIGDVGKSRHQALTAEHALMEDIPDLGAFLAGFGESGKVAAHEALGIMRYAQEKTERTLSAKLHAASEARATLFGFCRRIERD